MAAVDVGARNAPPVPAADDLDDLFDYNPGDVFRDVDTNIDVPAQQTSLTQANGKPNIKGLGIDEEIKIIKKRAPVPKLDDDRLLGPAGIPKLRRITKDRLRFKGKGHEYSDIARLLNVYQLWLDELYPRAKFADGLTIIEKLGHTKRMQTMRREWINEGKPKDGLGSVDNTSGKNAARQSDRHPNRHPNRGQVTESDRTTESRTDAALDAKIASGLGIRTASRPNKPAKEDLPLSESLFVSDGEDEGDQPQQDDFDALLAEDDARIAANMTKPLPDVDVPSKDSNFEDEMEAMADMDDMW